MIGFVEGPVAVRSTDGCYIDVGGVGYKLSCSAATLAQLPPIGERTRLWTHQHVREDVLALYGFATESERSMFEALIGVTGVGPKVALAVCSAFDPEAFKRALVSEDVEGIASVPGLGRKTAARIVMDVKDRLQLPDLELVGRRPDALAQVRSALENLGYSSSEVRAATAELDLRDETSVEGLLKDALRVLAG